MTTPRIEEMVEELKGLPHSQAVINPKPLSLGDVMVSRDRAETLLRKAHQAGRDAGKVQALHLLEDLYAKAEDKAELIEMFNEALQDNK